MESDPKLRPHYRRVVLKQTVEKPEDQKPHWINKIAAMAISVVGQLGTVGLAFIVLFAWQRKLDGCIIGADGIGTHSCVGT